MFKEPFNWALYILDISTCFKIRLGEIYTLKHIFTCLRTGHVILPWWRLTFGGSIPIDRSYLNQYTLKASAPFES